MACPVNTAVFTNSAWLAYGSSPTASTEATNTAPLLLIPVRVEKVPDVGVDEYTATPFESNRSSTVIRTPANAFNVAVPTTVNIIVQISSGPLAVSLRVCGDDGDAVMANSVSLTRSTDAAHTPEFTLTLSIRSCPLSVLNRNRNVLIEYVPAYARTTALN
jgi:hypothetical protein